ncbi:zinc phosphodiesterase ELAC protein [Salix suchowensis]|nr:zinc phosphodiesterase ELAC protein [Salix suchowensis]
MSHISNLRLLFSPLLPTLRSPFSSKRRPYSLLTILSSSSPHKKRRHLTTPNHLSLNFRSRSKTTSRETRGRDRDEGKSMDESGKENPGFNKKRAEGRDNTKRNLQLKVRKLNPTNTISYVQILGTGMDTQDTSPSVLLFFDKQRFIFNAGEGLQRFCTEHKIKLSKIDHIFLSRVCSETAGGIPGLLLTLAGMGEEGMSVNIWGPSDLKYLVDAMKSFIPHAAMVHTKSFGNDNVGPVDANKFIDPIVLINDEVVKISAILLRPNQSQGSALKPGDMSVIYLCELAEIMGKFDPEKAKALGLKPGPKYRELQSGRSVMSDHQDIMVLPSDVMDPSVPGPIVLLVDCPTESHVQELLSTESLNSYYVDFSGNPTQIGKTVNCIIHLSPASVTRSPTYQKWMKKFGSAQHIMAGHEMKNVEIPILKSSARIAARLNYLCPQFFPAPGFWSLTDLNNSRPDSIFSGEGCVSKLYENTSAENLLKFTLRPHANLGFDKSNIPSLMAPSEIINELLSEIPEIVDAAQHVREFWSGPGGLEADINVFQGDKVIEEPWLEENTLPSCLENIRRDDLEVVLLGTGSSQPSKYRNVTSIYINLFSKGSLLLDCGEGTLGQLKRRYGVEGADNAVRKLRCIWISHIHADHHTGLARILALRRDLLKGMTREPILVVGPWQLKKFLDAYQILEDLDMQFIDCRSTTEASWVAFEDESKSKKDDMSLSSPNDFAEIKNSTVNTESNLFARGSRMQSYWKRPGNPVDNGMVFPSLKRLKEVLSEAGLEALISFPVVHCPQAFGIALKATERINTVGKAIQGWKIVYSGDTRPCPELVEASRGATILIHEATFEDALVEEAIARNHSTTEEAIEVGNSAGAYRIILTHFSQRYPKIPVFDDTHMHKTCIAFDMMSVNIADLPVLPRVLPYLKMLFRNEMVVDESDDVVVDPAIAVAN